MPLGAFRIRFVSRPTPTSVTCGDRPEGDLPGGFVPENCFLMDYGNSLREATRAHDPLEELIPKNSGLGRFIARLLTKFWNVESLTAQSCSEVNDPVK